MRLPEVLEIDDELALDQIREADRETFLRLLQDREISERTLRIPYPYGGKDADWWIGYNREQLRAGQNFNWAIRRRSDHALLGCAGFAEPLSDRLTGDPVRGHSIPTHWAEIGYWIGKEFWGKGITPRAVSRLCRLAFEEIGLVRLIAPIFAFNTQSARVLEKCGFEREGYLRKHYLKEGRYLDGVLYAKVV